MAFSAVEVGNGLGINIDSVTQSSAQRVFLLTAEGTANINHLTAIEDFLTATTNGDTDTVSGGGFEIGDLWSTERPLLVVRGYGMTWIPGNRKQVLIRVRYSTFSNNFSGSSARRGRLRVTTRQIVIPTFYEEPTDVWTQGDDHIMQRAGWLWSEVSTGTLPVFLPSVFTIGVFFQRDFLRIGYEIDLLPNNSWAISEQWLHEGKSESFTPGMGALEVPEIPAYHGIGAVLKPSGPEYFVRGPETIWGEDQSA